ncbi:MAG TPA: hypothetical protein VMD47_00965 [Candidatus Acidoferrales bacterium]|nr:hypothetical protein [Candidatus Acidoferrales bacterium]
MRILMFVAMLALVLASSTSAQTTDADVLLHRLAAQAGGTAQVFIDKLPPDVPKVPLPDAKLVGSVHQSVDSPLTIDSYDLYYDAKPDTLSAYADALLAAGWKEHPLTAGSGGFVSSTAPQNEIYCKSDGAFISTRIGTDPQDLRVSIQPRGTAAGLACGRNALMAMMRAFAKSPLPELHAPAGVQMSVSLLPTPNGQSAAYVHNGTSASALLAEFASQMAGAGWKPGPASGGTEIVAETFAKVDDKGTPWQSTISIQAVEAKPGEFVAFINAVNLTALAKGESTLFSR